MKEYILRVQGEMVDLEPMEKCERCSEVVDSEAAMLAVIKALRERIDAQEKRIKELEARPIVTAEPLKPFFDHLYRPDLIRYVEPELSKTSDPLPLTCTVTCGAHDTTSIDVSVPPKVQCTLTPSDVRSILADELNRVRT